MAVQGLLYQLAGENACRVLIVTTVGEVDIRFAVCGDRNTFPNVSCGGPKRVRYRETVAPGVSNAHALTERRKFRFLYQKIGKRKIKKLSQHVLLITGGCTDKFTHVYDVIHIRVVPFFLWWLGAGPTRGENLTRRCKRCPRRCKRTRRQRLANDSAPGFSSWSRRWRS